MTAPSREVPINPAHGALLIVDVQKYCVRPSSSVFISTNIDYVLRNLGVRSLIIAGMMTDQCVESAVRDARDLGYLVTLVTDACCRAAAPCP